MIRSFIDWVRTLAGGWTMRLVSAGLFITAMVCFFLAGAILIRGESWAHLVYAENPYAHFFGGVAFFAAWKFVHGGYREPLTIWKNFLGKLTLLLLSLGFSFFVGEIGLRVLLHSRQQGKSFDQLKEHQAKKAVPIRSSHPLGEIIQPSAWDSVVYELRPNLTTNFGERTLRTNSRGMRESRDYPVERIPHSVRILGLGDSGMFGWNLDQDQDYLSVLENLLNARRDGVTYEAINMAVPGYNTQLEVETLRHKGLAFAPDIVIVGWCENDGQLPFFLLENEDFTRKDVSFLHLLLFRRDDYRQIASGSTIKDLRTMQVDKVSPELLSGTEAEGLRKAFTELKDLCDQQGFKLLIFGPLGRGVRQLVAELGIPYYNTYEKVDADLYPEEWSVHFMHPAPQGHRVLGEHLTDALDGLGWLKPKP